MGRYALHPRGGEPEPEPSVSRGRSGEPRKSGRMPRPAGMFTLAPGLRERGDVAVADAITLVLAEWDLMVQRGELAVTTLRTHSAVLTLLQRYLKNRGISRVADIDSASLHAWFHASTTRGGKPPTANTIGLRQSVARAMYRTFAALGITDLDVTSAVPALRKPARVVRPLTEADVLKLKKASVRGRREHSGSSKAPAALALALLGLQSKEIPATRVKDVDLIEGTVLAHDGGARVFDRLVPIDDTWAWTTLAERVQYLQKTHGPLAADMPLAYEKGTTRGGTSTANPAAATSNTIDKVFADAGVKQPGRIRIASLSEYVAIRVYRATGSFVEVAFRLGMSSLDAVAHIVHDDWLADRKQAGPKAITG